MHLIHRWIKYIGWYYDHLGKKVIYGGHRVCKICGKWQEFNETKWDGGGQWENCLPKKLEKISIK